MFWYFESIGSRQKGSAEKFFWVGKKCGLRHFWLLFFDKFTEISND